MKARKFFKKLISLRWIVTILIVLCLGIVAVVYFTVGINTYAIDLNNMPFDREGFTDFNTIDKSQIKKDVIIDENKDYIMFMDEDTTIVSVCVKSSKKNGTDGKKVEDYNIVYNSAKPNGTEAASNFELSYASTSLSKQINGSLTSFSNSVHFENDLTKQTEKHYAIKYLTEERDGYKGVQVDYTIGNFGSKNAFFPQKYYATVYKPARVLYDTDDEWNKAVADWESGYLATVGSLANTFEERFRGSVEIPIGQRKVSDGLYDVYADNRIFVHSEEAFIYLRDVVFPALEADGIIVPILDIEDHKDADKFGNIKWEIRDCPDELIRFDSPYYKKYFNVEDSPLTNNPFLTAPTYATLVGSYQAIYADGNSIDYSYYKTNISSGPNATRIYDILYNDTKSTTKAKYKYTTMDGEEVEYLSCGYPARDDNGNFLYDEDGLVKRKLYTHEQVEMDNTLLQTETEGLPVFKIALEFKLTDKGLVVTVPRNSIVDSTNFKKWYTEEDPEYALLNVGYQVVDIKICPKLTSADDTQSGYLIVPDGSGAIINFNNGKTSTISAPYYGKDLAYVDGKKGEDPAKLLLGMFAFVNTTPANPGGLLTIVEKGAGQVILTAGVNVSSKDNFANLTAQLRGRENVKTGVVGSAKGYDKWDKILSPSDIVVNYQILDETETSYSAVAKKYQNYLVERDGLTVNNDKTNKLVNDITFLGTFEKYDLFAGIKYKKSDTLTTFKQAEEIITELGENNVNDLSISYRGWTNEYLEYEVGGALKVAGKLGHTAGIRSFYKFCVEKQIPFFPELSITSAKGYNYLFGSTKFTTRGVGNEEAVHYSYDLASLRPDKKLPKTYTIAPQFYHEITLDLMKGFNKLKVWKEKDLGGFYLTDLGNQWAGNYRKGHQIYGAEAVLYQQDALDIISKSGKIKISAPCDYAFKYVDSAVNVPVASAMYTIYDAIIPFYQLVINGLFDYSTEQINGLSNRSSDWYFAKALESGSNIAYILSYEDPAILLNTDYTQYYQAYYQNWKDFIIGSTKVANELGIYACNLTDHECYLTNTDLAEGVTRVTYSNKVNPSEKIVLVINGTDKTKTYKGTEIPAYGFIKEA